MILTCETLSQKVISLQQWAAAMWYFWVCCGTLAGHGCAAELLQAGVQSPGTCTGMQSRNGNETLINGAALERGILQYLRTANGQDLSQRSERDWILISLGNQVTFFLKTQSQADSQKTINCLPWWFISVQRRLPPLPSQWKLVSSTCTWAVTNKRSFVQ